MKAQLFFFNFLNLSLVAIKMPISNNDNGIILFVGRLSVEICLFLLRNDQQV